MKKTGLIIAGVMALMFYVALAWLLSGCAFQTKSFEQSLVVENPADAPNLAPVDTVRDDFTLQWQQTNKDITGGYIPWEELSFGLGVKLSAEADYKVLRQRYVPHPDSVITISFSQNKAMYQILVWTIRGDEQDYKITNGEPLEFWLDLPEVPGEIETRTYTVQMKVSVKK